MRDALRIVLPLLSLLLVLCFPPLGYCAEVGELLSASDAGYALIEVLQGETCKKKPSHNCNFDENACRILHAILSVKMFGEVDSENEIAEKCSRVSTKHEMPGSYKWLMGLYSQVHSAAVEAGLKKVENVRVGTLAVKNVNVSVTSQDKSIGNIILFNVRFLEFANSLAKIAALTIPIKVINGRIAIDAADLEDIDADMRIEQLLSDELFHFLELNSKPGPLPPKNIQPILARYQEGVELFAMAHEYGHLAYAHAGPQFLSDVAEFDRAGLNLSGNNGDWAQELEADFAGTRIVFEISRKRLSASDLDIVDFMLIKTPQFYHIAREIFMDAKEIVFRGNSLAPPNAREEELLEIAKLCVSNSTCELSKKIKESGMNPDGYPHPRIRRKFADSILARKPIDSDDALMQLISNTMERNLIVIWDRLRGKYLSSDGRKALAVYRNQR
jgi:hypothetical protein